MMTNGHIFISYARKDGREHADYLYAELERQGRRAWRDTRNENPYQDFTGEIEKAIRQASHVVVIITADTEREDSFVRREVFYSLCKHKPIIPLIFADAAPPVSIVTWTWIDFFQQARDVGMRQLLERLELPLSEFPQPEPPDDPFRDYLSTLYDQIVDYLNLTVFSEIPLHSEATPDAVQQKQTAVPGLLASFHAATLHNKERQEAEKPSISADVDRRFDNFDQAFEYYGGRVLLLGEPGAGKTTTLMAFARDAVARRLENPLQPLPILARVADWPKDQQPTLIEWLKSGVGLLGNQLTQHIASSNTLLLLDGLDELGGAEVDPETKQKKPDPRLQFMKLLPENNRVLVTCRIKDYEDISEKIKLSGAVKLTPLDDAQIGEYLKGYPELFTAVQSDEGLGEIVRTPLLLSLFTFAFNGIGTQANKLRDLQHNPHDMRRKVFEIYIQRRYEHEKLKTYTNLPYDLDTMCAMLGETSVELKREGAWSVLRLKDEFAFNDIEATLLEQAQRLHLVVPIGDKGFRFIHLLIRDYFAIKPLVVRLRHTEGFVRSQAAEALGGIGDMGAVEPLISALYDSHSGVKSSVAGALGRIGDVRAVEPLIAALYDADSLVRFSAAGALGRIGDVRAVEPLIAALHDAEQVVQMAVEWALNTIGTLEANEALWINQNKRS